VLAWPLPADVQDRLLVSTGITSGGRSSLRAANAGATLRFVAPLRPGRGWPAGLAPSLPPTPALVGGPLSCNVATAAEPTLSFIAPGDRRWLFAGLTGFREAMGWVQPAAA
jgi:hypothetical protein